MRAQGSVPTPQPVPTESHPPSVVTAKPASRSADTFPATIKSGGTVVKVYRTPTTVRGKLYENFTVAWTAGGVRRRKVFSDSEAAMKEARQIADQKERGELAVASMSAEDRLRLADALRELGGLPGEAGAGIGSLVRVVREWGAARRILPSGVELATAVKFYAERHPANLVQRTVAQVVEELIEDRRVAGCSQAHLADLRKRLGRFGVTFKVPISYVSGPMLRDYLKNLRSNKGKTLTNRSRRNDQRAITTLFHFARAQKYITRDLLDDISEIKPPKVEPPTVEIFTPQQMAAVLRSAPDDIRAAMAIGAFAGLRLAELQRLDWSHVKMDQGVIVLDAGMTKTASRRVVPILPNLAAWLAPLARKSGPVSPAPTERATNHRFTRVARKAGVAWVHNALRHSFCSYRLAATHDPARVAMEAGNSPAMLFRHYRELVTEAQGHEWFGIMPSAGQGADILPFQSKPADVAAEGVALEVANTEPAAQSVASIG